MKIRFLGTNHGMEETKTSKNRQGILVETGNRSYLFDLGAPAVEILKKENYDFSKIKAVFVSHAHEDHIHFLPEVCENDEIKAKIYLPDFDKMEEYTGKYQGKFYKICEGNFYNDLFCKVSSVKTKHLLDWEGNSICHGFLIEAEGKKVHITSDMSSELKDFPKYLSEYPVDMLISECSHFEVSELFEKLEDTKAEKVGIIHVFPEEKYDELNSRMGKNNFELLLPNDGDEYEI